MRRFASRLFACCALASTLLAVSPVARATDYADLWWVPTESGWGMQTAQQGNLLFITLYVYDTNRYPTWYVGVTTTSNGTTFTGNLLQTAGPYFGGAFAPPATNRTVGTVTFTATSPTTATLTYTVDGVAVTKSVERQLLALHNLSGSYIGTFLSVKHSCANPASNGQFTGSGQFTIAHSPPATLVTITAVLTDNIVSIFTCTYTGNYSQLGKIGNIAGTYQCTSGQSGTWNANEIELSTLGGILGRYSGTVVAQGCQLTGGFGGLKPPN